MIIIKILLTILMVIVAYLLIGFGFSYYMSNVINSYKEIREAVGDNLELIVIIWCILLWPYLIIIVLKKLKETNYETPQDALEDLEKNNEEVEKMFKKYFEEES